MKASTIPRLQQAPSSSPWRRSDEDFIVGGHLLLANNWITMVSPDRSRGTLPNADLRSSAIRTRRGTRHHRQRLGIRNWVAMPCRGEESWLIPAYRRHRPDESLAATVIEFLSCWPLWITVMIGCENTYLPFQLISEQFLVHLFLACSP
jgi:hypothetical protein